MSVRLLLDENFNNPIRIGLIRVRPNYDIMRAQDIPEIAGKDDITLLEWAAQEDCILLTHDVHTITAYANERVAAGKPMPGVIEVNRSASVGTLVEEILLWLETGDPGELEGRVVYVPIR
jgi:hypothetical protein